MLINNVVLHVVRSDLNVLVPVLAWEAYKEGTLPEGNVPGRPDLREVTDDGLCVRADGKFVIRDGDEDVVIKTQKTRIGTQFVQEEDSVYKHWLGSLIYRNFVGKVPEGWSVGYCDRCPSNCALDNLILVSSDESKARYAGNPKPVYPPSGEAARPNGAVSPAVFRMTTS